MKFPLFGVATMNTQNCKLHDVTASVVDPLSDEYFVNEGLKDVDYATMFYNHFIKEK